MFARRLIVGLLLFAVGSVSAKQSTGGADDVDPRLSHLSKSQLKQHYQYIAPFGEYRDPKLEAYLKQVGERVLAQSGHAGKRYAWIIRDNPMPGASVLGTPVVYVDRGLFAALNSEAELAGVIGHEIGHNVGRHIAESKRKVFGTNALAILASIMVGNSAVGNAVQAQRQVSYLKYRRENETEADAFGAEYMYKAKYAPTGLISGLSQVFDVSKLALGVGVNEVTHHGLRASHPREDKRLRRVLETAGKLPPGEGFVGRDEYREAVEGLIYGPNYAKAVPNGFERYTNESLGITFLYPSDWSFELKGSKIVMKNPQKTAQMKITIEKTPDTKLSSEQALKVKYPDGLVDLQKIYPESPRDLGTVGARPAQRVALVMVARNTFHFLGIAKNNQITAEQDKVFVDIIRSFRRMTPKDKVSETVTEIYYERLAPGQTFASLAASTKGYDKQEIEYALRVLNGYYPNGEAEPGTWIKKLRQVKIKR